MLYPPHPPRSVTESNTCFHAAAHRWKWIAGVSILLTTALLCVFHPGPTEWNHRRLAPLTAKQLIVKLKKMIEPYRFKGVSNVTVPDDIGQWLPRLPRKSNASLVKDQKKPILPGTSMGFGPLLDHLEKDDLRDDFKIQLLLRLTPDVFICILKKLHMREYGEKKGRRPG